MKSTKKRLLSFVMTLAVLFSILLPALASEDRPNVGDRFKYYTVTAEEWTEHEPIFVTKEESTQIREIEGHIVNGLTIVAGKAFPKVQFGNVEVSIADVTSEAIKAFIKENNLDYADSGTYTIYAKSKVRYKEHLLTGEVIVDQMQMIVKIDFESSEKTNSKQMTLTVH